MRNHLLSQKYWMATILLYLATVSISIIEFSLWKQVLDLNEIGADFFDLFNSKNVLRYFLVLPVFKLEDMFGVDADWLFSILVACMILAAAWLVARLVVLIQSDDSLFWPYLYLNTLAFIFLSLFMNGRLSFAFAGISLIQLALFECILEKGSTFWFLPKILLGMWLCSVSSGCFMVALIVVYAWLIFYWVGAFKNTSIKLPDIANSLLLLLAAYFIYPIALIGAYSQLYHYNNNWVKMLFHGLGEYALEFGDTGFAVFFVVLLLGLAGWFILWTRWPEYRLFWIIIPCALLLGLFGYSTMLTGLPAVVVLANIGFINYVSPRLTPIFKPGDTLTKQS